MNFDYVLALDPSGNFTEGKGTTGFSFYDLRSKTFVDWGSLSALDYSSPEEYWDAHVKLLTMAKQTFPKLIVVFEDYLLYAHKASSQINSRLETPQLLGILKHNCWVMQQPYAVQTAAEVVSRWSNEILLHKEIIHKKGNKFYLKGNYDEPCNRHTMDSIRHAIHYATFKHTKEVPSGVQRCAR